MSLTDLVEQRRRARLAAYREALDDVREHAGIEESIGAGGYGYRQVLELVQNGADAILEASEQSGDLCQEARVEVVLGDRYLYAANTGAPLTEEGLNALLQSHSSRKRGNQIGRFGLGFKSLLRLGGRLDIFSQTGGIRFDPERCRREIRETMGLTVADPVPSLRLAWSLDEAKEAQDDPMLARFEWATTIVRAELREEEVVPHLRAEIDSFPPQFLLLLPVPVGLVLSSGDTVKRLRREPDGLDILLHEGDAFTRWRVVEHEVRITDVTAWNDATHLHARESVLLAWAIPLDARREERGRFWAYFPTDTPTRLAGILNAPWKLNNDRKALIDGEWNRALMREAAALIVQALPALASPADPGRPVDGFPRRYDRGEPAAPLVEAVWSELQTASVIADGNGSLRPAPELQRHPSDDSELVLQWAGLASEATSAAFVHPTCLQGDRRARLEELASRLGRANPIAPPGARRRSSRPDLAQVTFPAWFSLIASEELAHALKTLQLAELVMGKTDGHSWGQVRSLLPIVPTSDGRLLTAPEIVIAPGGLAIEGTALVRRDLCDAEDGLRLLSEVLKVRQLDDTGWRSLIEEALRNAEQAKADTEWRTFWARIRVAPQEWGRRFARENVGKIRVRRRDATWVLSDAALLPGRIVREDDQGNIGLLVDQVIHETDHDLLNLLGTSDCPEGTTARGRPWEVAPDHHARLDYWKDSQVAECRRQMQAAGNANPQSGYVDALNLCLPRGWMLLAQLKGPALTRWTNQLLERLYRGEFAHTVTIGHVSTRSRYRSIEAPHPLPGWIYKRGAVLVGSVALPTNSIRSRQREPVLRMVSQWASIQKALQRLSGEPEGAMSNVQIAAFWDAIAADLATSKRVRAGELRELWPAMARDNRVPKMLPGADGPVLLREVFVTGSADLAKRIRSDSVIAVDLDGVALPLWLVAGARKLDDLFAVEWSDERAPATRLATAVPDVEPVLREDRKEVALCKSVSDLRLVFDGRAQSIACLQWQGVLHLDPTQLSEYSRVQQLSAILHEAASAGWLDRPVNDALRRVADSQVDARRRHVAAGETLAERLARSVGDRPEPLRNLLGESACRALGANAATVRLADLVLALFGPAALSLLAETLKDEGLDPPPRWGSVQARAFVDAIAFPEEFAASREAKREPELSISGPIFLPPLHDYQEEVVLGLRDLLEQGAGRRRAVVSLPTGAGKTRVTVQAAVDIVLKPIVPARSVLWIAQTDELCEQAVQAFRQVWVNRGAVNTELRVVRLWGGHPNPAPSATGQPTVVIASIQTLNSRIDRDLLAWLSPPGLVVIDECHHAIAKSYSGVLRWLDADAPRVGAVMRDEPPIIGLSATPFRAIADDDENLRLAKRFDQRWLPADQARLHERLVQRGVLAMADHQPLQSQVRAPDELIDRLIGLGRDQSSIEFENLLDEWNRQLAGDEERNQMLVDVVADSCERSILFFANSVDHSVEIAARLHARGIAAAAISGDTPSSSRRYFLERFQRGEVRVLCNHSVLATGFDAPKTDMVLIARQVMSPVRYMQMVGRGLRGERNGGTARCRIVTVVDNLGRFSDKHPYHFCAKYFDSP